MATKKRLKRTAQGDYILPNGEKITVSEQKALRSAVVSANRKRAKYIEKLPKDIDVVSIFLYAPKEELINRLIGRGEKNIEKRMERYDYENAQSKFFDYIIDNKNLNETVEQIEKIIGVK